MNAIVETLRPRKTKAPLEIQMAELKRQVRSMSTPSARPCMCERCTCTPARAEMLRRR